MFDSVGWGETAMLLVLALFVVGPDRLPGLAADAARVLRGARRSVSRATADLKHELGPELGELTGNLRDLQPRSVIRGLLADDEPALSAAPEPFAQRSPARREDHQQPTRSPRA